MIKKLENKHIKIALVLLVFLSLGGYGYYQSRGYIRGPQLFIQSPTDGETITAQLTEIRGQTKNISKIDLNDRQIFVDESGHFVEQLLLHVGYNIIKVSVEDRYGRNVSQSLEIVFKPED